MFFVVSFATKHILQTGDFFNLDKVMKVKDLISALQKADPEMDVCDFQDSSVIGFDDVAIYKGKYKVAHGNKLIMTQKEGDYVGIGNPGDFEGLNSSVCEHIKDLT